MEFNINNTVYVRLTQVGKNELIKQHAELKVSFPKLHDHTPKIEDDEGWSKWQMWDLMNRFGHLMSLGFTLPFETDIKIGDK
jgi:hypothetical protein